MPQKHVWVSLVRRVMTIGAIGFLPLSLAAQTRQPDNHIKNSYETEYIGDDIYNYIVNQTKTQRIVELNTAIYHIKVENDGSAPDSFRVFGSSGNEYWQNRYFDALEGGTDITDQVSSEWSTGLLSPGAFKELRVEVTQIQPDKLYTQFRFNVVSHSYANFIKTDAVRCWTLIGIEHQPDNLIASRVDSVFEGDNIYNDMGQSQTKREIITGDVDMNYYVMITNDGIEPEAFSVTAPPGEGWWTVNYFAADSFSDPGINITSEITGDGWITDPIIPGGDLNNLEPEMFEMVRVEVTPDPDIPEGDTLTLLIISTSQIEATMKDAVRATTLIRKSQPDNIIKNDTDSVFIGWGIYNIDGADQTKTRIAEQEQTVTFDAVVLNNGNHPDSFVIRGTEAPPGWRTLYFWEWAPGDLYDVTSYMTSDGFHSYALDSERFDPLLFKITVSQHSPQGAEFDTFAVDFTSTSGTDNTKIDVVKAVTIIPPEDITEDEVDITSFLEVASGSRGNVLIEYGLTQTTEVSLAIYDVTGRQVRILEQGVVDSGRHTVSWDGCDGLGRSLPRGVYFCRLETEGFIASRKVVLSR